MLTFIKQYGEIRTGTNYLRALIMRNFPEIQVLSYILGSKHLPPADFERLRTIAQKSGSDAAFSFVSTATYDNRGGASHPKDPNQHEELIRLAPLIESAFVSGSIGYLVSIKNPYSWIVSAAKFNGWIKGDEQMQEWSLELMRTACTGYNRNYRAWLDFIEARPQIARIVRYEDLLDNPGNVLTAIAGQFGWRLPHSFATIPDIVEPTQWDHLPIVEAKMNFNPAFYARGDYLRFLPEKQLQIVRELIDWDLLQHYGYYHDKMA